MSQRNLDTSQPKRELHLDALYDWLREELAKPQPEIALMVRVVTKEVYDWYKHDTLPIYPPSVPKPSTQWAALVEGVVAFWFHIASYKQPDWTKETELSVGWSPYDDSIYPIKGEWLIMDVFNTPVELLGKGVILTYDDLKCI